MRFWILSTLSLLIPLQPGWTYEPIPRRIPPMGEPIPDEARTHMTQSLAKLRSEADRLESSFAPDIEIFLKAVDFALEFGEFYQPAADVAKAERALSEASVRLAALREGSVPWSKERGLVVRGYRSTIDGSAQPYGLEIIPDLDLSTKPVPLYVWLHGRGDKTTDLHFIDQRASKTWQFHGLLDDGVVLHPFGRQCIGYKSAGEVDVLDAIDHVLTNYNVDPDRIALMGFSMGGAGAWHLGAHYPDRWAVVHAGAGFVDVKRYQRLGADQMPSAIEQSLWGLYDVPNYGRNLLNLPVIAYSGEVDKQKDAADYMEEVLRGHGRKLPHVIGAGMGHKYDPESLRKVAAFVKESLAEPKERNPDSIHLQTRTLRYNRYAWLEITGLQQHWDDSRVDARSLEDNGLEVSTTNISSLRIDRPLSAGTRIRIDESELILSERQESTLLSRRLADNSGWQFGVSSPRKLRKTPGLQGPIDDAFLAPFLVVTPTGSSNDPALDEWVQFELDHFQSRWRSLFRGTLRTKKDVEVTDADAGRYNLVLFGTPESNKLVADAIAKTSLAWPTKPQHVLLAIYPNPAARGRYLVLNSGPTFREAHDRTNSLQNPKLGDWAIVDFSEPPGPERPGRVVEAGFFDENWQR